MQLQRAQLFLPEGGLSIVTAETPQGPKKICKKCGADVTFSHKDQGGDPGLERFDCTSCGTIPENKVLKKSHTPGV